MNAKLEKHFAQMDNMVLQIKRSHEAATAVKESKIRKREQELYERRARKSK